MVDGIILSLFLLILTILLGHPVVKKLRRERLKRRPFPQQWLLERAVPIYRRLPPPLQAQLHGHLQIFLDEKQFIGCAGLLITEEIKVTIAAQACILLLNRETDYYPQLKHILVYPAWFIVNHEVSDEAGVHTLERQILAGESWESGKVIISWESVQYDTQHIHDGANVVFHEFAHQLDHESGTTNGAPLLNNYSMWAAILNQEYQKLREKVLSREPSLIDYYGANSPAEFFAVVTETFFEKPYPLRNQHPQLYEQLKNYYRVDPCQWT